MKSFFLHIILTIVILDSFSLCQVLKFPSLIQHFQEHKALNEGIDFMDFLAMHYWGEDLNDDDDEKDMQLPFKKFEVHHVNFTPCSFASVFFFRNSLWPVKSDYGPDKPQVNYNITLGSLFHPPRA